MSSFTGTNAAEIITTSTVSATVKVRGTSLFPSFAIDTVFAGGGNDFVQTGGGNDIAYLGSGDDIFVWNPGDGSDFVDGQSGVDALRFNGSNAFERMLLQRGTGTGLLLTRDIGNIRMTLQGMERIEIAATGGADAITVADLAGSTARTVAIDLAASIGGTIGDGATDSVALTGRSTAETIVLTGSGSGITVTGLAAQVTIATIESTDALSIAAMGGNDLLDASALTTPVAILTLDGGDGADTLLGSAGNDVLIGGNDNDHVTGGRGADTAFLGAGDDTFLWRPGDGSDVVEGQGGVDTLEFIGANASENISLTANLGRALLFRDVGNITMDLDDVERVLLATLGGSDFVTVGDLTGTDVARFDVDLAGSAGSGTGDGANDSVTINGTNGADTVSVTLDGAAVRIAGLAAEVRVLNAEATDALVINAGGGSDVVDASNLPAARMQLTLNGGLGDDLLLGSAGADLVNGGDGLDTALLGGGDDTFVWNPGDDNDVIEGQAGFDTLDFRGANIAEIIDISANGGRALFTRNIAAVTQDANDVERISFTALGGADVITGFDLTGTDVTDVDIRLNADGQSDVVRVRGTAAADVIVLTTGSSGELLVLGLAATVRVFDFEAGVDRLVIEGLGGDDVIEASAIPAGSMLLTLDGGDNDDVLIGGDGNDTLLGGNGDDVLLGGGGIDVLDDGPGDDIAIQSIVAPPVEMASVELLGIGALPAGDLA
jgi:Ca2+-binding RTX toxin-like protein